MWRVLANHRWQSTESRMTDVDNGVTAQRRDQITLLIRYVSKRIVPNSTDINTVRCSVSQKANMLTCTAVSSTGQGCRLPGVSRLSINHTHLLATETSGYAELLLRSAVDSLCGNSCEQQIDGSYACRHVRLVRVLCRLSVRCERSVQN